MRRLRSAVLLLPLVACGGTSRTSEPVPSDPVVLEVLGQGPDSELHPIPAGSSVPSAANGTDFGEWTAGTLGNPFPPKLVGFRIVNAGASDLVLDGPPFVEVTGPGAARFPLQDLCAGTLAPGQAMDFTLGFDGMGGVGRHDAQVVVHPRDAEDFTFVVSGTTVLPSQH
jgi:hypothetical protein